MKSTFESLTCAARFVCQRFNILCQGFQWIHSGCFLCNMNGGPIQSEVMAKDQDIEVLLGDFREKGYMLGASWDL